MVDAMRSLGRQYRVDSDLIKRQMAEAGLVDIKEEVTKIALNGWPSDPSRREIGRWFNLGITQGLQALTLAPFCRAFHKTPPEINAQLEKVQLEVRSIKIHSYFTLYVSSQFRSVSYVV